MTDYSNVLGNKPKPRRMQIYPMLDHFRRASDSGWMRPFDLAEFEAYHNAESEWPARGSDQRAGVVETADACACGACDACRTDPSNAGAAVGLLTTPFTRGKDVVFPQGTTLESVLSRPVVLQLQQLDEMSTDTGTVEAKPDHKS